MADRRTPKSLQGLLNFCVNTTQAEDVESSPEFQALTDEDKEFIQNAIQAAMGSDPVKQMIEDLQVLMKEFTSEEDLDTHINALENLQMYCEQIDLANDFYKIGGYQVLPSLLSHEESELRWRAADLVATLVQNNPYSQEMILDSGFMPILLEKLDKDEMDVVRIKMLYAVSCLSRDYDPAQEELIKQDGFSVFMRTMQRNNVKLQTKAAFLIAYLCSTRPSIKGTLCDMGFIEQLTGLLHQEHAAYHEHLVKALVNLTENFPRAIEECQRQELNLQKLLSNRVKELKGKDEFEEELEYCQEMLSRCFPDNEGGDR